MLEQYLEQYEAIKTTLCLLDRNDLMIPRESNSHSCSSIIFEQISRYNYKFCANLSYILSLSDSNICISALSHWVGNQIGLYISNEGG